MPFQNPFANENEKEGGKNGGIIKCPNEFKFEGKRNKIFC
jgi:hypothetical protein